MKNSDRLAAIIDKLEEFSLNYWPSVNQPRDFEDACAELHELRRDLATEEKRGT